VLKPGHSEGVDQVGPLDDDDGKVLDFSGGGFEEDVLSGEDNKDLTFSTDLVQPKTVNQRLWLRPRPGAERASLHGCVRLENDLSSI
jgi:hypothetical protein